MPLHKPVRNKADMYRRLSLGEFGNTIPQYFSLREWESNADLINNPQWGIRVLTPGDPRMRLYIPTESVPNYVRSNFPDDKSYNISPMVDQWAILKGELWEADLPPYGLWLHCSTEAQVEWRQALRQGRTLRGVSTLVALRHYLTPSSYEDMLSLLEHYPKHVIEFSACDRNVGLIAGRNCVIWEVRCDDGTYEKWLSGVA